MSDTVITVENLSKAYLLGVQQKQDTLFGSIASALKSPLRNFRDLRRLNTFDLSKKDEEADDILWALRDVSFEVKRGEVLGIIGRNGAGKSTLLKILSRIADPTRGRAEIRGRVSALLEVGTGFHPELTGRENVYLNGTILGMKKTEIDAKFDQIVDFSGVERFLDTPIKRYSSGMKVRLAFAVAAHLEPEILIIDEVLAVGDAEFQKKCLGKMQDVATGEGRTILFVSHNMGAVADLCSRAIQLENGALLRMGNPRDIISAYMTVSQKEGRIDLRDWDLERRGHGPMRITYLQIEDEFGRIKSRFAYGDTIVFRSTVEGKKGAVCIVGVTLRNEVGHVILHLTNTDDDAELMLPADQADILVTLRSIPLNDGQYNVTFWLGDGSNIVNDVVLNCLSIQVESSVQGQIRCQAPVRLRAAWSALEKDQS